MSREDDQVSDDGVGGDDSMSVSYEVVVTASVAVPGAILPVCVYVSFAHCNTTAQPALPSFSSVLPY